MTVVCNFQSCPYYEKGFCAQGTVTIKGGVCTIIYKVMSDGAILPRELIKEGVKKEEVRIVE